MPIQVRRAAAITMSEFSDWEVIDTYSTKQAVKDGYLVRIDEKISKEAGIKYPVYLTRAVWNKYVELPEGFSEFLLYQSGDD